MKKYFVEILETNTFSYEIDAENEEQASDKAMEIYGQECVDGKASPDDTDTIVRIDGKE